MIINLRNQKALYVILLILFIVKMITNIAVENIDWTLNSKTNDVIQTAYFDNVWDTATFQNNKRLTSFQILFTKAVTIWTIVIALFLTLFCFIQYYFKRFDLRERIKSLITKSFHGSKYKRRHLPITH